MKSTINIYNYNIKICLICERNIKILITKNLENTLQNNKI